MVVVLAVVLVVEVVVAVVVVVFVVVVVVVVLVVVVVVDWMQQNSTSVHVCSNRWTQSPGTFFQFLSKKIIFRG